MVFTSAVARRRGRTTTSTDTGGLPPAHGKGIKNQRPKGAKRKANALMEGALVPAEQQDALEDALAEKVNMVKRPKGRLAASFNTTEA